MAYEIQLEQKWEKSTVTYDCKYRWYWEIYLKPHWDKLEGGWADTEDQARMLAKQAAQLHYLKNNVKTIKEDYNPSDDLD